MAAIAAHVRPASMGPALVVMAGTDLTDLLPHIAVPTLPIWGTSTPAHR